MKDEELRLALEALETMKSYGNVFLHKRNEQNPFDQVCEAITAIKAALEQPEPEPVAKYSDIVSDGGLDPRNKFDTPPKRKPEPAFYGFIDEEDCCVHICYTPWASGGKDNRLPTAYYTYPPKREWQGLTDEEMNECWGDPLTPLGMKHARMIEAKLKEKNA